LRKVNSLYIGPAGSALGAGRTLFDGTLDNLPHSKRNAFSPIPQSQ